jgi:hypothetical protein
MANLLQMQNKSKLIDAKAKDIFLAIKRAYDQGEIASQTEYLYRVFHGLEEFYNSIGKPTMQARQAWGPPFSEDYNLTMNEIHTDIATLYSESDQMATTLNESFRQNEIDRQSMNNRVKQIEDRMKEVALKIQQSDTEVVFRDSFIDQKHFDKDMVYGTQANIWTREGILTLKPVLAETYNQDVSIRIIEGNGLPGNTKQVRSLSGSLKFVGEDNLHIDLAEILDGNSDTWFEYETFEVAERTRVQTSNIGFEYYESIPWTIESGEHLRLVIEIELPIAKTVNWFLLSMFIPNDKGANAPIVKSIQIHDGKGKVSEIANTNNSSEVDRTFTFSQQKCKRITIVMEQLSPYDTTVGHLFFKELEEKNTNFMDRNREKSGKRITGKYPSVENLGVRYDAKNKGIDYPTINQNDTLTGIERRKQNLFSLPSASQQIQVGFEEIPAWRYVVGIRDAAISNYQFDTASGYISTPFISASPMLGVSLLVNTDIPTEFPLDQDWVKYFISIDEGKSWNQIYPRGTSKQDTKVMYLFNSNTPNEGRIDQFGYIDILQDIYQIRLKIELSRPLDMTDSNYYTPIVRDYQLHVITQGDES